VRRSNSYHNLSPPSSSAFSQDQPSVGIQTPITEAIAVLALRISTHKTCREIQGSLPLSPQDFPKLPSIRLMTHARAHQKQHRMRGLADRELDSDKRSQVRGKRAKRLLATAPSMVRAEPAPVRPWRLGNLKPVSSTQIDSHLPFGVRGGSPPSPMNHHRRPTTRPNTSIQRA
jgi:hypothetical protein